MAGCAELGAQFPGAGGGVGEDGATPRNPQRSVPAAPTYRQPFSVSTPVH